MEQYIFLRVPGYKKLATTNTTNMAAELSAVLKCYRTIPSHFRFSRKKIMAFLCFSRVTCQEKFESVPGIFWANGAFYSVDEFQSHFRLKRSPFEVLVREVVGTGSLSVGNVFGSQRWPIKTSALIDSNLHRQWNAKDAMFLGKIPAHLRRSMVLVGRIKWNSDFPIIPVKTRKEECLWRYSFFPKNFQWKCPFHLIFHRSNRFFAQRNFYSAKI